VQEFEVIHPFHPLYGQRFPLLSHWKNWGGDRVLFEDEEGCVQSVPTAWTTCASPDPFLILSAGRSFFRIEDLLALVALVEGFSAAPKACKDDSAGSVREYTPVTEGVEQ
jgi:hypothetical protein